MLANSVGLALLVVPETLEPAEGLAFVLHDVFGMSFDEIEPIVDRSSVGDRGIISMNPAIRKDVSMVRTAAG